MALTRAEKWMHPWNLPHRGDTELKELGLTIVTLFYNDVERLDRMFNLWKSYPDEVKDCTNILIVDDCSKDPIHHVVEERRDEIDFNLTMYRITDSLKWNMPGAWNLGITKAPTDWVLNVASDCCFDIENITKLLTLKPRTKEIYKFYRRRITNNPDANLREGQPHSEVFLQHKDTFLKIGGFDEDFTGERSGGYAIFEIYFNHKFVKMKVPYGVIRDVEMIEYLEDITGGSVQLTEFAKGMDVTMVRNNRRLWRDKMNGVVPERDKSDMIRFEWEKTFEHRRGK